jgi:hypothetical protein
MSGRLLALLGLLAGCGDRGPPFSVVPAPGYIFAFAVADFDGDGNVDIVGGRPGEFAPFIQFGDGLGGFPRTVSIERHEPTVIEAAVDFNGDGRPDLAVSTKDTVDVYINDGTGNLVLGDGVFSLLGKHVIVDLDGDGWADFLGVQPGRLHVFKNNPMGNPTGLYTETATIDGPFDDSLIAGDFDGNGTADLLVSNAADPSVSVFLGDGQGQFGPPQVQPIPGLCAVGTVSLADFDGDGHLDAHVFCQQRPEPAPRQPIPPPDPSWLLIGDGAGNFTQLQQLPPQHWIAAADFDLDGRLDAVVAKPDSASLGIASAASNYNDVRTVPMESDVLAVSVVDINHDGRLDLIAAVTLKVFLLFGLP